MGVRNDGVYDVDEGGGGAAAHVIVDSGNIGISGAVPVTGPLTDAQLRASAVPVSGVIAGTVAVSNAGGAAAVNIQDGGNSITVDGPLTDTQLRATPVPVSGTVVTGGLTDTQLRASAVPVSGPLTDTQLRASSVPVSIANGSDVAEGNTGDSVWSGTGASTIIAALKRIATSFNTGAKGAVPAGAVTSSNVSSDRQLLDVVLRTNAGAPVSGGGETGIPGNPLSTYSLVPANAAPPTNSEGGLATTSIDLAGNLRVKLPPSDLMVTATAAANTAVTATLPAAGAGKFHYITNITLQRASTAALAGTAVLVHTSTNLPGNPAWTVGNAMLAGDSKTDLVFNPSHPLKSSVANTATTIVMPAAGLAVINRINVTYYVGF